MRNNTAPGTMKRSHVGIEVQTPSKLSRRTFFRQSAAWAAAASLGNHLEVGAAEGPPQSGRVPPRKMRICLSPGMIGVRANMTDSIRLAGQYGFEAIEPVLGELAVLSDSAMDQLREELKGKGLALGAAGTATPIGRSQEQFGAWLGELPKLAAALQRAGGKRMVTWISCGDAKLTYRENFRLHARRVGEIATVLDNHGLSFGLEYIGPKTSWTRQRYPFIHTMQEMKELIAETGKRNVGFLLDSWHWYTAGESPADILSLRNEQIVGVHLNDAPAGIPVDQQVDNRRALPATTSVIDIAGFLGALLQVGYDGPVAAEPFDAELGKLPPDQALQSTIDAIRKAFNAANSAV
jgi:sugar phosphate isomerase/epimerase